MRSQEEERQKVVEDTETRVNRREKQKEKESESKKMQVVKRTKSRR